MFKFFIINFYSLSIFTYIYSSHLSYFYFLRASMDVKIEISNTQKFKKFSIQNMIKDVNPKEWQEMDDIEGKNDFQDLEAQPQKSSLNQKQKKPNADKRHKKFSEIEEYQKALVQLRKDNQKFYKPFEKHRLNISIMTAIKMLQQAMLRDKDFVKTLRQMGCKTRMRVRNKKAATQLFAVMLRYLEKSEIPHWMKQGYVSLLQKPDSQFDEQFMKMEQRI